MDIGRQLARSQDISTKVSLVFQKRTKIAQEQFAGQLKKAYEDNNIGDLLTDPLAAASVGTAWYNYALDAAQRSILFWDTLRQRGNNFVERTSAGLPPVLHFDYEMVVDGRDARAAGQLRAGAHRAAGRRDGRSEAASLRHHRSARRPRPGHRRLQGRFAGRRRAARRAPGLFRHLLPRPGAGTDAARRLRGRAGSSCTRCASSIRESPKPAIIGNCQGGWAAMMLAAADPDDTGPIVINGAPMSYWGGAWQEGAGDNPMRYAGGMLGGTWLSSFAADLGNGVFDGAYLVENFENLNPANTFWDKYYHLFANVDTEPPRFLEFERWWGGFYLMNREEIEWITRNLFVGNKLWSGDDQGERAARRSTCARSRRRSSCSRRWATTSRRRSRRSTGWPTSTARPTRSRRAAR